MQEYYIWLFIRYIGSCGLQPVPGLGGFTSATGSPPPSKSTVDYCTPIHQPITDNAVVRELLKRSEAATAEVGQRWVLNTFDLGVCMKALPIIWRWPNEFASHVVTIGPFHTSMNYIGMLTGHKMRGSGYAEILFEAQLVTSGSLKGVLSGKAYAKSLFCLKTVCEAMERLLMERFTEEENIMISDPAVLLRMTQSCNREHLDEALKDPSTLLLIKKYHAFEEKVRKGHLGKTAAFWMSFITHCHLVFMLLHSVKTNNLQLFHKCNGEMADIFFAFDGHNYSRYLTWLEVHLTNLESTHPGAKDKDKSKVDLARLPPCQSALKPHIQRVNHRVALYKRADQPIIEKPKPYEEQGWIRTDEGLLKPMWSSGPILPTSLVDLLNTGEHEEEEEEEGEEEFDSDDFDENDDD
uniref:uncharacterized protein n=3 Tax=Myxine glutinosa TaxID=7769 RepID=UPI00358FFE05